ncbi:MAG: 3-dehydroquinate synthase family protein [Bacteroidales bacterium]|nr:3-dehydroquinate synthase family protein [Bacteroidales bacterium]
MVNMLKFADTLTELLVNNIPADKAVFIIADSNVSHIIEQIKTLIINNLLPTSEVIDIFTGENNKTMFTIEKLVGRLMERGADRNCFIVGVGGGITTDIVGFTASIYKRGVDFGFIPTTLLAQTDASIGGKNGVNFNGYKNILGVINQPKWIGITPEVLRSLHPREFRAGIAEMLKTFIIYDKESYNRAVSYFSTINNIVKESGSIIDPSTGKIFNEEELTALIKICAGHKLAVVEKDEFETGERRVLNLGHTFAHAIEKEFNYPDNGFPEIMHGEAVALGVIMASKLAGNSSFTEKITEDYRNCGFPTTMEEFVNEAVKRGRAEKATTVNSKRIISHIKNDKKIEGGKLHLILPYGFNDVRDIMVPIVDLDNIVTSLN